MKILPSSLLSRKRIPPIATLRGIRLVFCLVVVLLAASVPSGPAMASADEHFSSSDCPAGYSCYYEDSRDGAQHPSEGYGSGEKWIAPSCGRHHFIDDLQPWSDRISFIRNNGGGTIKMYNWEERWVYLGAVYPDRQVNLADSYANDKIDLIEITCDGSKLGDCSTTWMGHAEGNGPAEKLVLSMTPTMWARTFGSKEQIFNDLTECVPLPENLSESQKASLRSQLDCHIDNGMIPKDLSEGRSGDDAWFGGSEWDLESWIESKWWLLGENTRSWINKCGNGW